MYNEKFIEQCMPHLVELANKYANNYYLCEDLLSEGQLYLLEYLKNKQEYSCNEDFYQSLDKKLNYIVNGCPKNLDYYEQHYKLSNEKLYDLIKKNLSPTEHKIIIEYYGFDGSCKSIKELSIKYNVSERDIIDVRCSAEDKIKKCFSKCGIKNI